MNCIEKIKKYGKILKKAWNEKKKFQYFSRQNSEQFNGKLINTFLCCVDEKLKNDNQEGKIKLKLLENVGGWIAGDRLSLNNL